MTGVTQEAVKEDEDGMRVDRWFKARYPSLRHGALEKMLRKGQVRVDGGRVKANRRLASGESIRVPPMPAPTESAPVHRAAPRAADREIIRELTVYEDDAVLAINKPFGLAVQGGEKTSKHVDGMLAALEKNGERPRLVHRLDRDTGGLLLLAKTRKAAQKLGEEFKAHRVEKTYWALTVGVPAVKEGTISMAIAKRPIRPGGPEKMTADKSSDAKPAITEYQIVDTAAAKMAFLALKPITGRTHQLRVHCAAMETPVVGDGKYGGAAAHIEGVSSKLHLFCRSMTFVHPVTGRKMTVKAELGGHMLETWKFFAFDTSASVEWPDDQ